MIISEYVISVAVFVGIWVTLALSLNILTGYAGQVSLGHAAFLGIGAYTSAVLAVRYGMPFWIDFLGAIFVTGMVGTVLGLPSLRVRHDFLVLATMGINFVVVAIFKYVDFFGGAMGLVNIPAPSLFGATFRGGTPYLALVWVYAFFTWLISWYLSKTWTGLAFHTVRIDEDAAAAVGVSVPRFKIYAFGISAALAGGAGSSSRSAQRYACGAGPRHSRESRRSAGAARPCRRRSSRSALRNDIFRRAPAPEWRDPSESREWR